MKNISFHFGNLYKSVFFFFSICFLFGIFFFFSPPIFAEFVPNLKIDFQNPTYLLEKETEKTEYECNQTKGDCKVNFDLRSTFGGTVPSTFACHTDFGFITGEEERCNPSTVTFPSGEFQITFRIYEKTNPTNFQEKIIKIKNIKPQVEIPDISFTIQSGLVFNSSSGANECKTASCSINLTVEPLFTGSYVANNYECLWDFGSGILDNSGSIQSCNPSYVAYPFSGTHSVLLIISEKGNPLHSKTGSLIFLNTWILPLQSEGSGTIQTSSGGTSTGMTFTESSSGSTETGTGSTSGSGEVIQNGSGSVSGSGSASETGSKSGGTSSSTSTGSNIPNIILSLQSPSYLTESGSGLFICDKTKSDCKANFDTRETFGGYISTKFMCSIDSNLFSGETDFCNPNTVTIPEGEYSVVFKIYEKLDPGNFKEKKITIINIKPKREVPNPLIEIQSGLKTTALGSYECTSSVCSVNVSAENSFLGVSLSNFSCLWNFGSGAYESLDTPNECNPSYVKFPSGNHTISLTIFETGNRENTKSTTLSFTNSFSEIVSDTIPPIHLTFQSPSYVNFQSWDGETLTCDPRESECKVNFSLEETFGNFVPSGFICQSDFGFQTGEENKCNPNTILFPQGKSEVHFKIIDKNNPLHFQEKGIFIENNSSYQVSPSSGGGGVSFGDTSYKREIIIQEGARKVGNDIICNSSNCKINLKYSKKGDEVCFWNYGTILRDTEQAMTCNPRSIEVAIGNYPVSLSIISSKTNQVLEILQYTLQNSFPPLGNTQPFAKITLQGKTSPKRILDGNTFTCFTKTFCSINVSAEESYDPDRDTLDYTWWFGQGEVSSKKNPSAIQYPIGKYQIHLTVNDGKQRVHEYLYIDVRDQKEFQDDIKLTREGNISLNIRIKSVKPNPTGKDEKEYIELQNLGLLPLNLKGFTLKSSKKSFTFLSDFYLKPFESKKIYKSLTNLTLGNTSDEISISFQDTQIDSLSWNFKIPNGYILTHENLFIETQNAKIVEVIDGDTIVIQLESGKEEKLRLIGVDTPETVHPNMPVQVFGKEASEFMKKLLGGKEVLLELDAENTRDIYGRLLGYIYLDGEMVNETLIREGYGRAYLRYPFKYSSEFEQLQMGAKKSEKGLWGDKEISKRILQEIKNEVPLEQKIPIDSYDYISKFWLLNSHFSLYLQEAKIYASTLWTRSQISKTTSPGKTTKQKFKKIKTIFNKIPFHINISKLKSGFKIAGTTLSGGIVQIFGYALPLEIQAGSDGKFLYKIEHSLVPGEYTLHFMVTSSEKTYEITKSKSLSLSSEYTKEVEQKWQKKLKKLQEKKKKKKRKKRLKKPKKIPTVKITQNTLGTAKPLSEPIPFFVLYYLLGLLSIFGGFLIYKKYSTIDKK